MSDLIVLSEGLLQKDTVPPDLLRSERFDLRFAQDHAEIIALVDQGNAKAVVLDCGADANQLVELIQRLRTASTPDKPLPIIGVAAQDDPTPAPIYYQAGVNLLLSKPLNSVALQEGLENILGIRFRRFERKPFRARLVLTSGSQSWPVTAQTVNPECVVIEGKELPVIGTNVLVSSASTDALSLYVWGYCWRVDNGIMVVRFLNANVELIARIENMPPSPSPPVSSNKSGARPIVDDQKTKDPSDSARRLLEEMQLLLMRVNDHKKVDEELGPYASRVSTALEELQQMIRQQLGSDQPEQGRELNRIKSNLQRTWISLNRARVSESPPKGPEPAVAARKTKPAQVQTPAPKIQSWTVSKIMFGILATVIMLGTSLSYSYWKMTESKRNFSVLTASEIQRISPYLQSVNQTKKDSSYSWRVRMTPEWTKLNASRQQEEITRLQEAWKKRQVDWAELVSAEGVPVGWYKKGAFRSANIPPVEKPN